ncbi:hypothetical protein [Aureimonas leprariae]|uniref:Lipoprotein n=1 Tax=Plantimonas leprariae TaxID=2615207 RepID=A0A7V7PR26_9HYPH|nr:hypothetical protein [Aureimonas leprariae]KAB0680879.1 hypothetical protein F6X38_07800 [Aureimonas leprariae]
MSLRTPSTALLVLGILLAGCSSPRQVSAPPRGGSALDRMERLTLAANRCWFKSGDPAFASYSLAPELSSFSGRPRFLLVPKGRPEAKPLLVVEGRNGSSSVDTYGPVMDTALGGRVGADIRRWNGGATGCSA